MSATRHPRNRRSMLADMSTVKQQMRAQQPPSLHPILPTYPRDDPYQLWLSSFLRVEPFCYCYNIDRRARSLPSLFIIFVFGFLLRSHTLSHGQASLFYLAHRGVVSSPQSNFRSIFLTNVVPCSRGRPRQTVFDHFLCPIRSTQCFEETRSHTKLKSSKGAFFTATVFFMKNDEKMVFLSSCSHLTLLSHLLSNPLFEFSF